MENIQKPITQISVSIGVKFFENKLKKYLQLDDYLYDYKPTLFFNCLNYIKYQEDFLNHKEYAILLIAGIKYDNKNENENEIIDFLKNIDYSKTKIITISNFHKNYLDKYNIPNEFINIGWTINRNLNLVKKKSSIYVYTSQTSDRFYGSYIYEEIYNRLKNKFNFIFASFKCYNNNLKQNNFLKNKLKYYKNPITAYRKCFIGLRLVPFDGNANTVKELGLCGIKVIHNGNDYNTIKWKSNPILFDNNINDNNIEKLN